MSSSELDAARVIATQYGLKIESRDDHGRLANIGFGAVAVGMLLALAILAMTVGLIRSESMGELRTLTATGATASTRRSISAVTAARSPCSARCSGSRVRTSGWPRAA